MFDMDCLAGDTHCLCCVGNGPQDSRRRLIRPLTVCSLSTFNHIGVEPMNGSDTFTAVTLAAKVLAKVTPSFTAFAERSEPSVAIRMFLYMSFSLFRLAYDRPRDVPVVGCPISL